jgi:hypothetical protein
MITSVYAIAGDHAAEELIGFEEVTRALQQQELIPNGEIDDATRAEIIDRIGTGPWQDSVVNDLILDWIDRIIDNGEPKEEGNAIMASETVVLITAALAECEVYRGEDSRLRLRLGASSDLPIVSLRDAVDAVQQHVTPNGHSKILVVDVPDDGRWTFQIASRQIIDNDELRLRLELAGIVGSEDEWRALLAREGNGGLRTQDEVDAFIAQLIYEENSSPPTQLMSV